MVCWGGLSQQIELSGRRIELTFHDCSCASMDVSGVMLRLEQARRYRGPERSGTSGTFVNT